MGFGGAEVQLRRFDPNMPFESGPASRHVAGIENELIETQKELTRLTNDLLGAVQRAEAAERSKEEDQATIAQLRDSVSFFRERSVMAISLASGLVATIRGVIPEAGANVLSIFKTLTGAVDKQVSDIETLVKDHLAGNREFMDKQRADREAKAAGKARVEEMVDAMTTAIKEAAGPQPVRSLEEIGDELKTITSKIAPGTPSGERGAPHQEVFDDAAATAARIEEMDRNPADLDQIEAGMRELLAANTPEKKSMLSGVKKIFGNEKS